MKNFFKLLMAAGVIVGITLGFVPIPIQDVGGGITIEMVGVSEAQAADPCAIRCNSASPTATQLNTCLHKCCMQRCAAAGKSPSECKTACEANVNATFKKTKKDPCKDKPGTRYCKILKECVPIAEYAEICKEKPEETPGDWCPSLNDGSGGELEKGGECMPCMDIGMMTASDGKSCMNPCDSEWSLLFTCVTWCASANDGHGGFVRLDQYGALCSPCEFGDNGIRCLTREESEHHAALMGAIEEVNASVNASTGGGCDHFWLYILIGGCTVMVLLFTGFFVYFRTKPKKRDPQKPKTDAGNGATKAT